MKIMSIFYGNDCLPYKDKERQVHYPIVGNSFTGASLTTQIKFYVKEIGGVDGNTWVANAKRPDGKIAYKQLTAYYDNEVQEYYVLLSLSQWFTEKKGDLYISLNGYEGGVDIQVDSNTGLYTVSGTPIIEATGVVKIAINYSTMMNSGYGEVPTINVQDALATLTNKVDKNSAGYIHVVDTLPQDTSNILDGTLYYSKATKSLYRYSVNDNAFYYYEFADIVLITDGDSEVTQEQKDKILTCVNLGKNISLGVVTSGEVEYYHLYDSTQTEVYFQRREIIPVQEDVIRTVAFNVVDKNITVNDDNSLEYVSDEWVAYRKEYIDSQFGYRLQMSNDGQYNLNLLNKNGDIISYVDLPLEQIILDAQYYETYEYDGQTYTKVIVLTLATTDVPKIIPIGDLISGLVDTETFNQLVNEVSLKADRLDINSTLTMREAFNRIGLNKLFIFEYGDITNIAEFTQHNSAVNLEIWNENGTYVIDNVNLDALFINEIGNEKIVSSYFPIVTITSPTQTLTNEQLTVLGQDNSKILYNDRLYEKANKGTSIEYVSADYDVVDMSNYKRIVKYTISVTGSSISVLESYLNLYDISQVDALLEQQAETFNATIDELKARITLLEETIISEDTLTFEYLSLSAIPNISDNSYPIIFGAGLDLTDIKGNSFVYNQLVENGNFESTSSWIVRSGTFVAQNNVGTLTQSASNYTNYIGQEKQIISGHKYFVSIKVKKNSQETTSFNLGTSTGWTSSIQTLLANSALTTTFETYSAIITSSYNNSRIIFGINNYVSGVLLEISFADFVLIDLTQSGLDSVTTVDEAIAELQKRGINPYEYNPYNAGEIINSKPTKLISHGFNVWDEEWENGDISSSGKKVSSSSIRSKNYCKAIPNTTYYSNLFLRMCYYDKDKNFLYRDSGVALTHITPSNCYYFMITMPDIYGTTYKNDICINFYNTSLNGTYKPYIAPKEYPLSLPILRSAGSVQDDTKKVNIGVVDLGTLDWVKTGNAFNTIISNKKSGLCKMICTKYKYQENGGFQTSNLCIGDSANSSYLKYIFIRDDSYTDAATFKTAMSGVYLNFELATPTDQPTITLPENVEVEEGGSLEVEYENGNTTPADFIFNSAVYKPIGD